MYYYVYKITNTLNNYIYIGRHQSKQDPLLNGYYGSGKLIKDAIKLYGIDLFVKEILHTCSSKEESIIKERELVTLEFINRIDTYNMHTGGTGGFEHINNNPTARQQLTEFNSTNHKTLNIGGTQHWTQDSWERVNYQSWGNKRKRGEVYPNSWDNLSSEERQIRCNKISHQILGEKNGSYGTRWYIDSSYIGLDIKSNIKRFKEGTQPNNWILISEWKDHRKKNNRAKGRHWYNNGYTNYFLYPTDNNIIEFSLIRGRLKVS